MASETRLEQRAAELREKNNRLRSDEPSKPRVNTLTPTCESSDSDRDAQRIAYLAERECQREAERIEKLISAARIPDRHLRKAQRHGEGWLKLFNELNRRAGTGYIALVTGARGTGKTQLAADLIASACRAGRRARYTKAMEFFLEVKATFDGGAQTQRDVVSSFCRPDLLVIDMVHVRGESAWEDQLLTHLVDERYDDGTDTILISNLSEQAFIESVGEDIANRAHETGGVIVCDWPSYRDTEAQS